jgi:hypothetical protein
MLCFECSAEMRLVQVIKDTKMPVSGFEQHTWQCSGCSTVEQRRTFIREKTTIQTVPFEPAKIRLMGSTETVPALPTQAIPVATIQTVPAESSQTVVVKSPKAAPVEPTRIIPPEPTLPEPSAAAAKMNARLKALDEKLRNLKERAKAAREAAGDTARPKFNWDLDHKSCSAATPSTLSETSSYVKPDEPVRSPTEPVASPALISYDELIVPGGNATTLRKRLGNLVRAMRRKDLSEVRFN